MDKIYFSVNGDRYSLAGSDVSPVTSLNDYLRNYLHLHGTKAMCHEGGCGACVVSVSQTHPVTKEKHYFAVNSCLVHILSCHEWDITTVEGVGNRKDGYHAIQRRLAMFNGTQCGYCTPGWVMNMYSLYKSSNKKLTMQQVENSFGGSMCRCTGYRPILDAFKSFANDADPKLTAKLQDVEDLDTMKCLKKCTRKGTGLDDEWCIIDSGRGSLMDVSLDGGRWYKAYTIQEVFKVLAREGTSSYRLVAGNTAQGVYPLTTEPKVLIDISSIETLKDHLIDANLVLGAGMTLTDVMHVFSIRAKSADFKYLEQFHNHLDLVAHVPVRNIGTIGGNLAIKNMHNDFPSDVFLLLETVGATVTLLGNNLRKTEITMQDFLKIDLSNKLITEVKLPPLSQNYLIQTYKIMPRAQNAHAIVNAGFSFKVDSSKKVQLANIVYGNINPSFINAKETANILTGLDLFSEETLQKALTKLNEELVPMDILPEPSPFCRKNIALGLFYKAILSLCPKVNPRYKSGGLILQRDVSHGTQTFDTDKSLWPLNKPVPKMEALTQCSGEVKYSCDVYTEPHSVHVAFVLSEICRGEIVSFDPAEALKLPGVVSFMTSRDIPGKNTFTPLNVPWQDSEEEILATRVSYYGQPIGVIAALTKRLALKAAGLVKVQYKKSDAKLVLNVRDALVAPDKERRVREEVTIKPKDRGTETSHVVEGRFCSPSQYHYTMETQSCSAACTERGVALRAASQWVDAVQVAVAAALALPENCVDVTVPRVGGAYGGKASRSALIACACALVAYKLNRTATLVMPITDNMAAIGKRQHCEADYQVGVNNEGLIQYLNITYYSECGYSFNDSLASSIASVMANLYDSTRWHIKGYSVLTDKPSHTWMRAPGTTEATAIMGHVMERISHITKRDPTDIRILNLAPKHLPIRDMITTFQYDAKYNDRKVEIAKYNEENAWKKRALSLSIMSYPIEYSWNFPVTISVYHGDGTILMSHGGIEMGQGINTKVAQVCAYTLKVPLHKVSVRASDSFVSPNAMVSNGSITSDCVAYATVKACEELLKRLEPARGELNEPTWEEVIKQAYNKGINLQASYMTSPLDSLVGYDVYGVAAAEIELDVLTGNHLVRRVDLLEDTGVSISPDIDVGQIEGAFVMGLGLWTMERLQYSGEGRLATDRTWTYKPPGARDIPLDFRVAFRRNSPNPTGVLRSKATGEPALVLAVVVTHALQDAILDARKEFGYNDTEWIHVDTPYCVENIIKAISPKIESFKIN